jgi:uncharacterized protein YdeI (YjbR/CyaY-like superfamily)
MNGVLEFGDREAFRDWLDERSSDSEGVWLLFGKKGGPKTLSANDALEEALCFGWIDGQMQSLDSDTYKKYFARRTTKSSWSQKNKGLAQSLIEQGRMARQGMAAIETAKQTGAWDAPGSTRIDDDQVQDFRLVIQPYETAYTNLLAMPPSIQKTYTGFFLDAKTEKTRQTRLERIIDRLNRNLKPM